MGVGVFVNVIGVLVDVVVFMILGEIEILRGVVVFVVGGLDGFLFFLILDSGLAKVGLFVEIGGVPVEFDIFVVLIGRLVVGGVWDVSCRVVSCHAVPCSIV